MDTSFTDFMKRGAQALVDCYNALDEKVPEAPLTVAPATTYTTSVDVPEGGRYCAIDMQIEGGELVDFCIFHRSEYDAYKVGKREVLMPVEIHKDVPKLRGQVLLEAGFYYLAIQNHRQKTITVKLRHKLRRP